MTPVLAAWTLAMLAVSQAPGGSATVWGVVRLANQSVEGAVVLLLPLDSAAPATRPETVLIDQRDLRFVPRVVVVEPSATIRFANSDPILHNVFSPPGAGPGFDLGTYAMGEYRTRIFDAAGVHVILCHVHPDMVAYVVVAPTRHRAVLDGEGVFELRDVFPGRYLLRVIRGRQMQYEQPLSLQRGQQVQVRLEPHTPTRRR